jgi:zinc protease
MNCFRGMPVSVAFALVSPRLLPARRVTLKTRFKTRLAAELARALPGKARAGSAAKQVLKSTGGGLLPAAILLFCLMAKPAMAADASAESQPAAADAIPFTQETLSNGLRVIYSPLHQAPVVHVRVLYHVGSRDERPDRQGFAHMFEHMMFRGSAHVAPQEHMKHIDEVGGICNAFTSFDETVYHNTIPAEDLEMALYLEADRMSSFKVSEEIYRTERRVVSEEWRIKQNKPYGNLFDDFLKTAFTTHSYRWTPIGNMQHLLAAPVSELQDFFNTYYIPNNAVLVIAGDIDVDAARKMVHRYFEWIPRGAEIHRLAVAEPLQTEPRTATIPDRLAPLTEVVLGYHIPPFRSDDQYPLSVLSVILGDGSSSRLYRLLVANDKPLCHDASTLYEPLEDGGIFGLAGRVLHGKSADDVKAILTQAVADIVAHGVSEEELAKAKTLARVGVVRGRETAEQIAGELGDDALFADDPNRINSDLSKLDAVTAADVQAVAIKYLRPQGSTMLVVKPDPLGAASRKAAVAAIPANAQVAPSTQPIKGREIQFPAGYPERIPMSPPRSTAVFEKGRESVVNGVRVIVMRDNRLPLVQWSLTMRRGSHSDPAGKEGLASVTADMIRRGAGALSYAQLNEELESHGITLEASDGGDFTRLSGSCLSDQLDRAFARSRDLLLAPTFPADEFARLEEQTLNGLAVSQESPAVVGGWEITHALYGDSPLGQHPTPKTISAITLDDVKRCFADLYQPQDAILAISGDITLERGRELAQQLTDQWTAKPLAPVTYAIPPAAASRQVILVDRPGGKGATIRIGIRAYDMHDPQKYAGALAGAILSGGIESRLNLYVRAQKGYVYGVSGMFQPGRYAGAFVSSTETKLETTGDTIEAIFKVLTDMRDADVMPEELADAKRRVIGGMVMNMQTIFQQAALRIDAILNGYPIDYFDLYPSHITAVTPGEIRAVVDRYVNEDAMAIVVVAPAADVKDQLDRLGQVQVLPMPAKRESGAATQPAGGELLGPAGK